MFRAPLRRIRPASLPVARPQVPRRAASTAPAKKGTWKGAAARWGVAAGALYWYCTSPLFADEPAPQVKVPVVEDDEVTVDRVIEQKRKEIEARAREREAKDAAGKAEAEAEAVATKNQPQEQQETQTQETLEGAAPVDTPEGSPKALEEEAGQQAAFNPETGEINWDCPCLGGMAHGPCGEEFRAAFSCFVYSDAEPKGMDCIDKFQGMQDCFRQHPDVYGAELADEDQAEAEARAMVDAEKEGKGEEAAAAAPKDESAPVKEAPVTEAATDATKANATEEPAKDEKSA